MSKMLKLIAAFIAGVAIATILNTFSPVQSPMTVGATGCMGVPAAPSSGDFRKYQQTCVNCTPNMTVLICKGDGPNCNTNDYFFRACGPRPGFEEP